MNTVSRGIDCCIIQVEPCKTLIDSSTDTYESACYSQFLSNGTQTDADPFAIGNIFI